MRLAPFFFLLLVGCGSPSDDLNAICEEVNNPSIMDVRPDQKATVLAKNIEARLSSSSIKEMWEALGAAAPNQRYKMLQVGAAEAGVENWQCPALEALWASPEP